MVCLLGRCQVLVLPSSWKVSLAAVHILLSLALLLQAGTCVSIHIEPPGRYWESVATSDKYVAAAAAWENPVIWFLTKPGLGFDGCCAVQIFIPSMKYCHFFTPQTAANNSLSKTL